ncbi:MAG: cation:proton antiporter [Plesiomonas sp.]
MIDSQLLLLISIAFLAGFAVQRAGLPPLIGFLLAGFGLNVAGFSASSPLSELADLGVTLLLFTIGLKLDIRLLMRREVLVGSSGYTLFSSLSVALVLTLLKVTTLLLVTQLEFTNALLLGFALSFSSTVLAVKAMQERGELLSTYGRLALGILVIQDLFAVVFLTASTGKLPHWWAIGLLLLPLCRPLLYRLLDKLGHDEILVLGGIFLALIPGAALFSWCGLKPDLGALVIGMLVAGHPRASELSKSLFNLKELFLICFFLQIGLEEVPSWQGLGMAVLLLFLLPVKAALYYLAARLFRFRIRTSLQLAMTLCNYSEFGLIVGGIAVRQGLLSSSWLVVLALTTALSFLISVPLNKMTDRLYALLRQKAKPDENRNLHPDDRLIDPGDAQILVLGMGRIGSGAYDELRERYGDILLGIESNPETVLAHRQSGRNVIQGDATDPDFWERVRPRGNVKLILLAMPHWQVNHFALDHLHHRRFTGRIAAIAEYQDELEKLTDEGVHAAFNIYNEAGSGFARHVISHLSTDQLFGRFDEDTIKTPAVRISNL